MAGDGKPAEKPPSTGIVTGTEVLSISNISSCCFIYPHNAQGYSGETQRLGHAPRGQYIVSWKVRRILPLLGWFSNRSPVLFGYNNGKGPFDILARSRVYIKESDKAELSALSLLCLRELP